jgi:hypothetical protein
MEITINTSLKETWQTLRTWYWRRKVKHIAPDAYIRRREGFYDREADLNGTWLEGAGRPVLLYTHWEYDLPKCWKRSLQLLLYPPIDNTDLKELLAKATKSVSA